MENFTLLEKNALRIYPFGFFTAAIEQLIIFSSTAAKSYVKMFYTVAL